MKRFHVHVAVKDIAGSIDFYNRLFGQMPARQEPDYAKWMLDDPRLNFAISARGHATGLNHFGMQVETAGELAGLKALAESASAGQVLDQGAASCCYANSEKHWTLDPQGLAWEHFHTLSDAVAFGEDSGARDGACCIPLHASEAAKAAAAACCVPNTKAAASTASGAKAGCCP